MVKNLGQCKSTVHILNLQKKSLSLFLTHRITCGGSCSPCILLKVRVITFKKKLDKEPPACQMCVGRFKMHNKGAERLLLIK